MFGSGGIQLFRRVAGLRECPDRSDRRLPLRSEHFPVQARGREIVTRHGVIIAAAADPAFPLSSLLTFLGFVGTGQPDSIAFADSFQEGLYQPVHTFVEDWINSPLGQLVDNDINSLFVSNGEFCGLICDGTPVRSSQGKCERNATSTICSSGGTAAISGDAAVSASAFSIAFLSSGIRASFF